MPNVCIIIIIYIILLSLRIRFDIFLVIDQLIIFSKLYNLYNITTNIIHNVQ